jgi:hypothetical protein
MTREKGDLDIEIALIVRNPSIILAESRNY